MAWLAAERSGDVDASPSACYTAFADVESWPEWQDFTQSVRVLTRDAAGRPEQVETEARTPLRPLRYIMRYAWEEPDGFSWRQVESELRDIRGTWRFAPLHDGARTRATLRVEGDPGLRLALVMRGPLFDAARDWLLERALDELRDRVGARP